MIRPFFFALGPTVGDATTAADALAIARHLSIPLPDHANCRLKAGLGVVAANSPLLALTLTLTLTLTKTQIIAAPAQSLSVAAALAKTRNCEVRLLGDSLQGGAKDIGAVQARLAMSLQANLGMGAPPLLLLSGGELTVTRRGPGIGGPNAEFALSALTVLRGAPGIHVLACDTDGVDGGAEVAGAYVTPETFAKARLCHLDAAAMLHANNSHSFFCGDCAAGSSQVLHSPM